MIFYFKLQQSQLFFNLNEIMLIIVIMSMLLSSNLNQNKFYIFILTLFVDWIEMHMINDYI